MKSMTISVLAVLLAGQCWGGTFRSTQVSSGATWVVHADLEQLRQTQLGAFVTNELSAGPLADKLAAFAAVFGFDPRKDSSGNESISVNSWFSPPMPQQKAYELVPQAQWIDQLGEITAWRSETTMCRVSSGAPMKCITRALPRSK